MTPSLVFGVDRLCPACKGRGYFTYYRGIRRPASPREIQRGKADRCTRCAGAGVVR